MSRDSQDLHDHAVPRVHRDAYQGDRISITYRVLRAGATSQSSTTSSQSRPSAALSPRRILILSDSKNSSFDCSQLHGPVIAFRENLFYLRDLERHRLAIEQSDVVLISSGINDIRNNKIGATRLHDHVKHFTSQFPNTQFIFDSISPLAMRADRFNVTNRVIDKLNELLLNMSLRSDNFKLFDNTLFGVSHLARDGLHLNLSGKTVLSNCWVHCILIRLGIKRGNLPLRRYYINIANNFRTLASKPG